MADQSQTVSVSPVTVTPVPTKVNFWAKVGSIALTVLGLISHASQMLGGAALPGQWGLIVAGAGLVSNDILHLVGQAQAAKQ